MATMATMDSENMEMRGRNAPKSLALGSLVDMDGAKSRDITLMSQMGKKQQLNRNFGFLSMIAFSSTLLVTWEASGSTFQAGLLNGGPSTLVYGFVVAFAGSLALSASLAEMASITPIAGGQYHWTAQFAPKRYAAFISWIQGWITVFAWQATVTSACYLTAGQIKGAIILNHESYKPKAWHLTLIMWAIIALTLLINIFFIRILPHIESLAGICHILFFFALLIPLVYLAPQSKASYVFGSFENNGGWKQDGISWCVGLLTAVFPLVGFDGTVHLSEEVENAATSVPRSMVLTVLINGTLAFGWIIALLFSIGDVQTALNSDTGYPMIEIFRQATGSIPAATAMISAIIIVAFFATLGILASTSRLTWAFARDKGFPFPDFFAYVNPYYKIPIRTIVLVGVIVGLLGLINIGSSTAFNAVLSLSTLTLYISYIIPIIILVLRKLRRKPIPYGPFRLGALGLYVNLFAIVYAIFICIFLPFPPVQPVTAENMNYASPVFAFVLLFSLVDWFVRGRKLYKGPIREVVMTMTTEEIR